MLCNFTGVYFHFITVCLCCWVEFCSIGNYFIHYITWFCVFKLWMRCYNHFVFYINSNGNANKPHFDVFCVFFQFVVKCKIVFFNSSLSGWGELLWWLINNVFSNEKTILYYYIMSWDAGILINNNKIDYFENLLFKNNNILFNIIVSNHRDLCMVDLRPERCYSTGILLLLLLKLK